jgi:LysM repeat protein
MVQRVPPHVDEAHNDSISLWLVIAGVGLILLLVCIVIFFVMNGPASLGIGGPAATPTRGRTLTPAITIIPVTLAPTAVPTATPTIPSVKYKVKSGDTLSAIAAKYKVSVQSIMTANGLKDDVVRTGDDLIIPLPTPTLQPGSQSTPLSNGTPTPISLQPPPSVASSAAPGVVRHIVSRGDTLISIAAMYGATVDGIRIMNQLDSDFLSIGQTLNVPTGAWTPTPVPTAVVIASATPTAQFAYSAPSLLGPSDAKTYKGNTDLPQLLWISPATLKPNEFYIVHIDYAVNGKKQSIYREVRQGTSLRLDAGVYPGANTSGTIFSWYVVIVTQSTSSTSGAAPITFAQSPPSATWTFVWY